MSLDLSKVAAQVGGMVSRLKDDLEGRRQRLSLALNTMQSREIDLEALKKKITDSRTTWLVAELVEGLNVRYPAPPVPADFTVLATDGSHIDVDRHHSTRCYLINTGSVTINYGSNPGAAFQSSPRLYYEDKDLAITPPTGREQPIEGVLLGIKRAVEECRSLADICAGLPRGSNSLALLDGSLILWGLSSEALPEFVTETLLDNGLLRCLEDIRKLNTDRRISLASYISFPRSTDVVNVLRVAICPHDPPDCDRCCPPGKERDCDGIAGIRDRDLFMDLLQDGERSALFISPSKIVKRYGEHLVNFFYVKLSDEIARVEVPQWVALNRDLLDLTHGLILDQCRRGHGYPVVLSEAHEQAVVTGADRENFWELVESSMITEHISSPASAKSMSKRSRWV